MKKTDRQMLIGMFLLLITLADIYISTYLNHSYKINYISAYLCLYGIILIIYASLKD